MTENWLPVVGYNGLYEVSDLGRVKSLPRLTRQGWCGGKILNPLPQGNGYVAVVLSRDGKRKTKYLHTLVLEAFVGQRPLNHDACHGPDRSRSNCRLDNLRWDTRKNNLKDRVAHGTARRGSSHPHAKLTESDIPKIFEMKQSGSSPNAIAASFGISRTQVRNVLEGKHWSHIGGAQ